MRSSIVSKLTALSVLLSFAAAPAFAAGAASSISVKIGYFNLALVKASYPESAGSETLRISAENQLRRDVEEGNKRLTKAGEDKKPKEELEKMAAQLQVEINAKQRALIELVQSQTQMANQRIAGAVAEVARDKGLDLIIDGAGVFSGGDKIVSSGEDVTDAVVKRLTPNLLRSTTSPAPAAKEK